MPCDLEATLQVGPVLLQKAQAQEERSIQKLL